MSKYKKAPVSNRAAKRERDRRMLMGASKSVSSVKTMTLLCIIIAGVALFCGLSVGMISNMHVSGPIGVTVIRILGLGSPSAPAQPAAPAQPVIEPVTQQPAQPTQPVQPAQPAQPTQPMSEAPDEPSSETPSSPVAANTLSASSSKEEIVEFFNAAANKIKPNAVKIVRNYEDLKADNQYLEVPDSIRAIGEFAMNTFLKRNDTPVEYATAEDIRKNFPVENEDWSGKVTPDQITNASVTDDGSNYIITLEFIDDTNNINPVNGIGYGTAFGLMYEEEVVLDYPGLSLSNISIHYHDGTIKCTVDKASGNIVESTYVMPMILGLTAKVLFSELDAQIGMIFEHNYTITY